MCYKFKKCVLENENKLRKLLQNNTQNCHSIKQEEPIETDISNGDDTIIPDNPNLNQADVGQQSQENKRKKPTAQKDKSELPQTFQCDVCGRVLRCHGNLTQHMRRHTGERPFACDLCEKKFTRAEHLNMHRR